MAAGRDEETTRTIERLAKDFRHPYVPNATIKPRTLVSAAAPTSPMLLPSVALRLPGEPPAGSKGADGRLDFEVRSLLGEGGMGRVYEARQHSLGREVAVKTLRDPTDPAHVRALIAEGAISGSLEHPNIPPIHQLGVAAGDCPVLVMKRILGVPWGELLRDGQHEGWQRMQSRDRLVANVEVLISVARAAQFAHSRGIVHRDIKPDNVMIDEMGEVYLVDWGIACAITDGPGEGIIGTPNFLAPEMVMLDELSVRTDVYLLGATLHYVLTGEYRNKGGDLIEVLKSAQRTVPFEYAASVPRELAELANRATAHDPAGRPQSAAAFREALAEYLAHRGSLSLATAANERLGELLRDRASLDHVRLVQIAWQARFGFDVALEQWPANPVAREGREKCLVALAEIELERENVSGARAAISELTTARPDLAERARELEQKLATRAESEERLKRLEHAVDVGISRSGRRLTVLIILVATTASSVALLSGGELRYRDVLVAGALPLAVVLIAGVAFRERLLANALGRKLFGLLVGASLLLLLHRVACWFGGVAISAMLRDQLFILSMAGFAGGLLGVRSWFSASALALLGGLASAAIPDRTTEIFAATVLVGGVLISVEPLRRERSPSPR